MRNVMRWFLALLLLFTQCEVACASSRFIGEWVLSDVRDRRILSRDSGVAGTVSYRLAPISKDMRMNYRFLLVCVVGSIYIDVDLDDLLGKGDADQAILASVGGLDITTENSTSREIGENHAVRGFIENRMLKAQISEADVLNISNSGTLVLNVLIRGVTQNFLFPNEMRPEAMHYFLQVCT